ncbi:MAG: hypothetical protein K6G15_02770 [Desulfovibrio sp.]|nr:hypothetical protein [Desulfovibrio sp.]
MSIIALHSKIEDDVNCNIWLVNNDTYENYYDDTEEVEGTMSVTLLGTVEGDTVTKDNVLVNMQLATSEDDVYA